MVSDFRILGVEEDADLSAVKRAFRKRAKELHPDLSTPQDAMKRHDLFIEVCRAYRRLLDRDQPRQSTAPKGRAAPGDGGGLVPHDDQAYVFYRQGMKSFMSIHPSQWNLDAGRMLNTRIAEQDEEQEEIKKKVMELVRLFPRAYYYFSIVVHDFPDSDWAFDAAEKMGKIEERMGRYRKIIESFTAWNRDSKGMIEEYRARYARMRRTMKAVRRDMPEDWR
jgi:hypothetical protein